LLISVNLAINPQQLYYLQQSDDDDDDCAAACYSELLQQVAQ